MHTFEDWVARLALWGAHCVMGFVFLALAWGQTAPPAPTPLTVTTLQRELEWTRREHQLCRQALGQIWAQGEEAETKVKTLTEQVQTLEAERAQATPAMPAKPE